MTFLVEESTLTLSVHGITLVSSLSVLGLLAYQHKIWVRMKDRVNQLWRRHCHTTGDEYTPLENGRH